jgi:hypothetical protein
MPTYAQILAFTVALAVLIGFGTATTQSMRHLESKQQRILDADIDRILALRREQRREDVAKAQIPGPNQSRPSAQPQSSAPLQAPAQAGARESEGAGTGMSARNIELPRETDAREVEPRDPEARQAMAQARKSARRTARATRRDSLVPRDLGRLPMFTVKTLLGFR